MSEEIATAINKIFIEIVIAPDYTEEALNILKQKKNIRIIKMPLDKVNSGIDLKRIDDGILLQNSDNEDYQTLEVVSKAQPTKEQMEDLIFANSVVKHVKSNAIAIIKNKQSVGLGVGQVNRIWAAENAIKQGGDKVRGAVLASDAFFPFDDVVEVAAEAGITAIIQPGGSINDQKSIDKVNEYGIAMVFTKMRHFKH